MLFFTFIKGGGVTPLTGPPNLDGFSSIIRGGGGKNPYLQMSIRKCFFLMKASLRDKLFAHSHMDLEYNIFITFAGSTDSGIEAECLFCSEE